jgi:hypothetical protein
MILGVLGLMLCVLGGIHCWRVHGEATRRLNVLFDRADTLLADAGGDVERVRDALKQVRADLATPRPASPGDRAMAAVARRLGDARPGLTRAVEIGMLADGVLDALAELSLTERAGVDTDRLKDASDQLSTLVARAEKLSATAGGSDTADETTRLADAVSRAATFLTETAARIAAARDRIAGRRQEILQRVTYVAVMATVVLVWIAVGQVCMVMVGRPPRHVAK